jgi:hypothetical protein
VFASKKAEVFMKERKTAISWAGILLLTIVPVLFFLTGCSTSSTLSTRASRVRLISAVQAHAAETECEFLGNVAGTYPYSSCCLFGFNFSGSYWNYNEHALNQLLDNAAELGSTHVFVNLGNSLELRGEAYVCAYCMDRNENPDEDYCLGFNGFPETDSCLDEERNMIGEARCDGADAGNPQECKAKRGRWVPAITQTQCETRGHTWMQKSTDRPTCESRGGIWRPRAKDQVSCESKGGTWVINEDLLRSTLSPTKGPAEGGGEKEPSQRRRMRIEQ